MPRPYPREIRTRVIEVWQEGGSTQKEIAERFAIGLQTVVRWVGRVRTTGSVDPSPMGGARRARLVDDAGEAMIRDILDCVPDTTLREICEVFRESRGVKISPQTMSYTVRRFGYTRKKGAFVHRRPAGRTS